MWSRQCIDLGQIEPTSVFRVTTDLRQIQSKSVDIWENGPVRAAPELKE